MEHGPMISIIIIAVFAVIVTVLTIRISLTGYIDPEIIGTMTTEEIQIYLSGQSIPFYLIPVLAFLGLVVGTVSFSLMSGNQKIKKNNTKVILKFLNTNEKAAVEKLLENQGKVQQIELTRLPRLNKVKTHRLLNDMERKGIIKREKYGKLNLIVLEKSLYSTLKG
jgi:uncharacterized membrane protein